MDENNLCVIVRREQTSVTEGGMSHFRGNHRGNLNKTSFEWLYDEGAVSDRLIADAACAVEKILAAAHEIQATEAVHVLHSIASLLRSIPRA